MWETSEGVDEAARTQIFVEVCTINQMPKKKNKKKKTYNFVKYFSTISKLLFILWKSGTINNNYDYDNNINIKIIMIITIIIIIIIVIIIITIFIIIISSSRCSSFSSSKSVNHYY